MTKLELERLKSELRRLKEKVPEEYLILFIKVIAVSTRPDLFFELLRYLEIKDTEDNFIKWKNNIKQILSHPNKIHQRD